MSWHQDLILQWQYYRKYGGVARIIPSQIQLGKLLDYHICDLGKVRSHILREIEKDSPLTTKDEYWEDVLKCLDEHVVNDLILE